MFVLTDEQILEIEPEGEVNVAPPFRVASPTLASGSSAPLAVIPSLSAQAGEARDRGSTFEPAHSQSASRDSSSLGAPRNDRSEQEAASVTERGSRVMDRDAQPGVAVLPEPPAWLAAQMKDPWSGEEAKEFWNGVQQARQEAAAYRAAFATPEDARALKELYPGGVNEARSAAGRAQLLDEIDRAYFGVPGGSAEQTSATRADLAQRMLREDPAAFREMVFAGLRALEAAEKGSGTSANAPNPPRLAQVFAANHAGENVAAPFRAAPPRLSSSQTVQDAEQKLDATNSNVGAQLYPERSRGNAAPRLSNASADEAHMSAYAAFEKAANEDLERSVGSAISRTIEQALPVAQPLLAVRRSGEEQAGVPALRDRLSAAVRQDVEAALKGDRQLGEQIAQILSARRFDNETRAQVVRLIDDRARQLVPGAAKRVINDWTHATLAAHRGNASRADEARARREVEPASVPVTLQRGLPAAQAGPSSGAFSSQGAQTRPGNESHRNASRSDARRLDYRKLSDEQILNL